MRAGALAAALAALVYVNALDNPFVYDDHDTVVANPSLAEPSNLRFVLVYSPFRPVVNVSYALDRAVWGYRPFGFHLTNVLLHALVVALLYTFLRRALADVSHLTVGRTAMIRDPAAERWGAFAGAALFGVHPLMSEAVAYVSGRSELLCGVFFLAALLCAREAFDPPGIVEGKRYSYLELGEGERKVILAGRQLGAAAAAVVFGVFALLSKEVAVVLPIVLLAYDWLLLPSTPDARRRRLWLVFAPVLVLLAAAAVYRLSALSGPVSTASPLLNLLTQAIVIWRYLGLLVAPVGQSIMHAVHRVASPGDPLALVALAGLLGAGAIAFSLRRRSPLAAFGMVWYLAVIAPSSSVIALREGMAEHRAYLASAGAFMIVAPLAHRMLERSRARRRSSREGGRAAVTLPYAAALTGLIVVLSALTLARNNVWSSPVALWQEAAIQAAGMWEPHYALADSLRESGDCQAAIPEYEAAVRLRPDHRDAQTNLGICLAQSNRFDEAERAFGRALEIDPGFARGYTNLGALALVRGEPARARDSYLMALEVDPQNVLARMQLARLYEAVFGDYHAAARMCGEARAIAPATPGVAECVERNQRRAAAKDAGR